jgi:UDP-N-acetylglucosamine--N-acetylmuramyl-(pentapeptide) pyrophosphoryl-undecaprenol N-acetylglucosamine transferase
MRTIVFTGGGTGGHIYPGLAVIERLRAHGEYRIVWIGAAAGMDRSIVEAAGVEFAGIPSGKLRRYLSWQNFVDLFRIAAGFFVARRLLRRLKPDLVFSKGGFASVPPCAAAASLGIPVFTHESDYSPGLATRLNSRWAERVLVAYPDTAAALRNLPPERLAVVGNPIRAAFASADAARGRAWLGLGPDARVLLVLGGSQGAKQVNDLVEAALPRLAARYTVVHQTGRDWRGPPAQAGRYLPFTYIGEELPDVLAAAELVVGRAGAGTVWEAAALAKPMLLIPLAGSGTRGDQVENAAFFVKCGAAVSLEGPAASAGVLADEAAAIADDPARRGAMADAARRAAGGVPAAERAAELIIERIGGKR